MRAPGFALGSAAGALALLVAGLAAAQPPSDGGAAVPDRAAATASDGGGPPAPPADAPVEHHHGAAIAAAELLAERLRALAEGRLEVPIDPRGLFEVDLEDEDEVEVEVRRLRALLATEQTDAAPATAPSAQPPGAAAPAPTDPAEDRREALYRSRLEVDRARLAFLELTPEQRRTHLEAHAARRAASDAAQPTLTTQREAQHRAEREAAAAAAERRRALDEMEAARSEALRLVAKERARLLGVQEAQSNHEAAMHRRDEEQAAQAEGILALRRRVEELTTSRSRSPARALEADALYDELRGVLRASRDELANALAEVRRDGGDVPLPGPDPLGGLTVDRAEVEHLRASLRQRAGELEAAEDQARWSRVVHLESAVTALNRDRHALYPLLPPSRRAALTGFAAEGLDQAAGEIDQLRLVTTYHAAATARIVAATQARDVLDVLFSATGLKMLVLLVALGWWRRAARRVLARWASGATTPTTALGARLERWRERLASVALRAHGALELLIAARAALWLVGPGIADLLAIRVAWIILSWALGGFVIVHAVDGLMAPTRGAAEADAASALRLRSLRLVGLVAVAFGLVLDLSTEIVGRGTLYAWVSRGVWITLLPIALVLVRWWRATVFARVGPRTRQSAIARWVAEHRTGAGGFVAAAVGAVYLLLVGAWRVTRGQMTAFDATRRVLAYLFRREVSRTRGDVTGAEGARIGPEAYQAFDPDAPTALGVPGVGDAELAAVLASIDRATGGVFAVVGERGSGKSTLVRRVSEARESTAVVRCPPGGLDALWPLLMSALGLPADAPEPSIVDHLRGAGGPDAQPPRTVVVDDAQRLIVPVVGGLDRLDALLALARASSTHCTWIFCFGSVMWQFVERARGVRPLFDDVLRTRRWSEAQIGELLRRRSAAAGIEPSFRALYDVELLDPAEREERARRTEADYVRLVWDAAEGNPAVALHLWREALRIAPDGHVVVSLFTPPDPRELTRLPLEVVFVLRAVLRLERVSPEDVARSTMVALPVVHDAIHFATAQGWIEERRGRYRVTWSWLRAVTVHLQRRHLLS